MSTPLFHKGEIVLYDRGREDIKCLVLEAYHFGRTYDGEEYRERYIIQSLEPEKYYFNLHSNGPNGIVYEYTNMCAGEYLKKINQEVGKPKMYIREHKI